MRTLRSVLFWPGAALSLLGGCKGDSTSPPDSAVKLAVAELSAQASVSELMRAAVEMQHSGEPLAEAMGRSLDGYDRNALRPDQYKDPVSGVRTDVVGYSSAVESYEYSKYILNTVSFESGAGLSLMYGPLVNPSGQSGSAALTLLRNRVQALAFASRAGVDAKGPWVQVPPPMDNPMNTLGFPGLWPEFAELRSFDPAIAPSGNVMRGCTFEGGYGSSAGMAVTVGDYECGYNNLHINRDTAAKVLELDALGYSAWKQGLWVINYFQLVHDVNGKPFTHVADTDLGQVGQVGNSVQADNGSGGKGAAGTYIGSSDLEGFQGLLLTEAIDNKAAFLLERATTSDGSTLGGFGGVAAALNYNYTTPLRYFPHAIAVTEQPGTGGAEPQPTSFALQSGESRLADLSALLGAYAEAFALTDRRNADIGGSSTVRPIFDGDPFALDNGQIDAVGELTLHDRSLAVLKVALVNLDRLHSDPTSGILCDSARLEAGAVVRTRHATTVEIVQAIVGLRNAYRALTAQLSLYGNATPDTAIGTTALDGSSVSGIPNGATVAARLQQIIKAQADFLSSKLVDADGLARNGLDLVTGSPDAGATTLEAQAAAVRGLLEAYLATSQTTYRDRAQAAYDVLEQRFHSAALRTYRTTLGDDSRFAWTPLRFGAVQAALREMYVLVGSRPGNEPLRTQLEARIGRLNKLVLNGWDDRNSDGLVDYPGECVTVTATLPRGGLMLAERALTAELGSEMGAPTADRDKDCVPEIDDAKLSALLASSYVLERR